MSNITGGFTGAMSPDAVQTEIDSVLYERFTRTMTPEYLSASDPLFFKQGPLDTLSFIWDEDSGVGNFNETAEQEEIYADDTFIGNTKAKASQKYTKKIPVSDEAFRADKVGKRTQIGVQVGDAARRTQDTKALLNTYADAFAGSVNTTPDGVALASNSHVTLKGATVDNYETGAATPDNMWTQVNSLANQKGQDGEVGGYHLAGVLCPFTLYKTIKEIMASSLVAQSGENQLNIFDTDYGQVQIRASVFLQSPTNAATNAATSYHLIGENHFITRKVFYGLTTDLIEPRYSDNDSWQLLYKYHEICFPGSWSAYVGTIGTT